MVCIYCGGPTQVANSREQKRLGHVWRRRACKLCGAVFTSIESADLAMSIQVTHPTLPKTEPFSRDKLFVSLAHALGHRSDAIEAASALTATTITQLLRARPGASIEAASIFAVAHDILNRFDTVAATLYAAYHPANT